MDLPDKWGAALHAALSDEPDEMTGKVIEFELKTPGTDEEIKANVIYALSLGFPEVDSDRKHLTVIANGPSAREGIRELGLGHLKGDTIALNGALTLFTDQGGYPTYWMGADSQPLMAEFVKDPPEQTTYLVASHCDKSVFDALWDRRVVLWHRSDTGIEGLRSIPVACSVTMMALQWAWRAGYRDVDVWGWDCCFGPDGASHAGLGGTQAELPLEVEVGPKRWKFNTRRAWAAEAQDALYILPILKWGGMDIRIHGHSLVAAVMEEFAAEPVKAPAAA